VTCTSPTTVAVGAGLPPKAPCAGGAVAEQLAGGLSAASLIREQDYRQGLTVDLWKGGDYRVDHQTNEP
jgi:hypothetical protein